MTPLEFVEKLESDGTWVEYRVDYVRLNGYFSSGNGDPHYSLRLDILGHGLTLTQSSVLLNDLEAAADFGANVASLLRPRICLERRLAITRGRKIEHNEVH